MNSWIYSIVFFILMMSMVTGILPGKKYEGYVRFLLNLLLLLLVLKPLLHTDSMQNIIENSISYNDMKQEINDFNQDIESVSMTQQDSVLETYRQFIGDMAKQYAQNQGMNVVSLDVDFSGEDKEDLSGDIDKIEIYISPIKTEYGLEKQSQGDQEAEHLKCIIIEEAMEQELSLEIGKVDVMVSGEAWQ